MAKEGKVVSYELQGDDEKGKEIESMLMMTVSGGRRRRDSSGWLSGGGAARVPSPR